MWTHCVSGIADQENFVIVPLADVNVSVGRANELFKFVYLIETGSRFRRELFYLTFECIETTSFDSFKFTHGQAPVQTHQAITQWKQSEEFPVSLDNLEKPPAPPFFGTP